MTRTFGYDKPGYRLVLAVNNRPGQVAGVNDAHPLVEAPRQAHYVVREVQKI